MRVALVLAATILACLVLPAAAPAASGQVVHLGKAAFVCSADAALETPATVTSRAVIAHGPGKAAHFSDPSKASAADGLTASLLVAAATAVALLLPASPVVASRQPAIELNS